MPVGGKAAKTKAREREHDEATFEAAVKAIAYKGKTTAEVLDLESFDPRVYAISMIKAEAVHPAVKAKLLAMLMAKVEPDLKSVESNVNQVTKVEIVDLPMPPEFVEVDAVVSEALTHDADPIVSTDPTLSRPELNQD